MHVKQTRTHTILYRLADPEADMPGRGPGIPLPAGRQDAAELAGPARSGAPAGGDSLAFPARGRGRRRGGPADVRGGPAVPALHPGPHPPGRPHPPGTGLRSRPCPPRPMLSNSESPVSMELIPQ